VRIGVVSAVVGAVLAFALSMLMRRMG